MCNKILYGSNSPINIPHGRMTCMNKLIKTKATDVTEITLSQEVTPNADWMKKTGVASVEEVQKLRDVVESGVSDGDTITAALNAHISNTDNPHQVTPGKIGAAPSSLTETVAALELKLTNQVTAHVDNKNNPHEVTPDKIGASPVGHTHTAQEVTGILTEEMLLAHTEDTNNPHGVTATQTGAATQAAFDGLNQTVMNHTADLDNPHGVTPDKIGAATKNEVASIKTDLTAHAENSSNPHGTTATQVGAPSTEEFDLLEEQVIAHAENVNNPHNVTHDQTGAAPLEHTHKVADITDKDSLVQYAPFAETRKTIQLSNYDSISGVTTTGLGANLIMVSKWDVADIGSPQIHANLNTIDNVTINDDKVIATTDQIPNTDNFVTKDNFGTMFEDEMITAIFPWDSVTGVPTEFTPAAHAANHGNDGSDRIVIDASQITSGVIDARLIPATAIDELVVVANDTERFALTTDKVQRGDHVKVTETSKLYEVIDDTKLSSEDGYVEYLASVDWVSVTGKPTEFTPISHNHSLSQITDYVAPVIPTKLPNPNALTIKYNGVQAFVYDGSSAETGNFVVTAETVPGVAKATDLELYRKKSDVLTSADISDFTTAVTGTKVNASQTADSASSVSWDNITGTPEQIITAAGTVQALADRLELVETQLTDLKKTNVVPVVMDSAANLNQPDADMVITAAADPIEGIKNVVAKSIDVKSMTASNAVVGMTATNDINVQSVSLTGNLPKETSNAQLKINTSEYVKITKSTFAQTGYNAVEVGLQTAPKNVIIDGLDFTVPLSNNAILIFQHQDDAVITISNCHFADVSNAVRISNKLNKRATVNIINCTVDKWDTRPEWAGFLIMQDYSSGSQEAEEANNLFAPDKLTINFINVVGPDGKVIKPTNLAEVCGTSDENQIIYVWNSLGGTIPYGDGSRYPTFTFK